MILKLYKAQLPTRHEIIISSALAVLLLLIFSLSYKYVLPAEDAIILFDYAKNLAARHIITYDGANFPIEGATDFLWMVLIALFEKAGISNFFSSLLLNFISALFLLLLARTEKIRLVTFLGLLGLPYLYSSLCGFSTLAFSGIYCLALYLLLERRRGFYLALLVLCLTRVDGIIWGAGLILWRLADIKEKSLLKSEAIQCITNLFIPLGIYLLWRFWYFSELFPLPFLVKFGGEKNFLIFNYASLITITQTLIPALIAVFTTINPKLYLKKICFLFLLPVLFYGSVALEQNVGNRLLAPIFFGGIFIFSFAEKIKPLAVFVACSFILLFSTTLVTLNKIANSQLENLYQVSSELSSLHGKMLTTEAGRLAYYSNWQVHDSWGLNTPAYAHKLISQEDMANESYDLIVAHCPLDLLNKPIAQEDYKKRSWDNQCKVLVSFIKSSHYRILLLPYLNISNNDPIRAVKRKSGLFDYSAKCQRYDIYAIKPNYPQLPALRNLLKNHGAIAVSNDGKIDLTNKCLK